MVTIDGVAQRAGVSASTVSHVLNGTRRVNEETRQRVEKAVAELGYRRNAVARTLAGGSSHTIGLVISGLSNPYFGPLVQAIERRASESQYVMFLGDTHEDPAIEQKVVDSLLDRRVDGMIVAPSIGFRERTAPRIKAAGTPLVVIDRAIDLQCDQLIPENLESTRHLTEHLIAHGHRRIAAVTGLPGLESTASRAEGYRLAMDSHGIEIEESLIVCGDSNSDTTEAVVAELLRRPQPPSALLVLNNAMAIGAMRAIKIAGLRIPGDVALATYDDFDWSDLFEPGLTAIAQNVGQMGRRAVDLLLERIAGDRRPFEQQIIGTTFHRRNSCGCSQQNP